MDRFQATQGVNAEPLGYPGADGWPNNNVHYATAILAADGLFESEKLFADYTQRSDTNGDGGMCNIATAGKSALGVQMMRHLATATDTTHIMSWLLHDGQVR
jgi:hypothetical protein